MARVYGESTDAGQGWQQYPNGRGIFIEVDTTNGHFTQTPMYATSLGGTVETGKWAVTGTGGIYFATPNSFRIYLRWADGAPLAVEDATNWGWYINWIGYGS